MKTKIPKDVEIGNKWPQMLVTGKSVTPEQAKEIIFRTDLFFGDFSEYCGGNNRQWNDWAHKVLGFFPLRTLREDYFGGDKDGGGWAENWDLEDKLVKKLKLVQTEYVSNSWASCAFIGGPHGWCHPSGRIYFDDNIGKWPCIEDVIKDWEKLVKAFPFLELAVTLFDKEDSEIGGKPICTFVIKDGQITFTEDHDGSHYEKEEEDKNHISSFIGHMQVNHTAFSRRREQGLPDEWIEDYGKKTKPIVDRMLAKIEKVTV